MYSIWKQYRFYTSSCNFVAFFSFFKLRGCTFWNNLFLLMHILQGYFHIKLSWKESSFLVPASICWELAEPPFTKEVKQISPDAKGISILYIELKIKVKLFKEDIFKSFKFYSFHIFRGGKNYKSFWFQKGLFKVQF